jgi:hypothetical protein
MKSVLRLSAIFVFVYIIGFRGRAQTTSTDFAKLVRSTGMRFAVPTGYDTAQVRTNGDVLYDFAIISKTRKLEIRYRVLPIQRVADEARSEANAIYSGMLITMGLNISGGQDPPYQAYPPGSVREEFGADAGATSFISCNSEFGAGYAKCLISVIHKEDVADAYAFFLFDDMQVLQTVLTTDDVYHALRFQ